jgi:hypothetical protein
MLGNEGPRPVILHINYGQEIIERSQAIGKKKWVVWNKAIEVNVSRPKTDSTINQGRLMCRDANHRFWDCRYAQRAWRAKADHSTITQGCLMCIDANHIDSGIVGMFKEHGGSPTKFSTICFMGPTQDDKLSQCNGSRHFCCQGTNLRFHKVVELWLLLRGIALWVI